MIQLVLFLLGVDYLRRRWLTLAVAGGVWLVIGVSVFIDALDGVLYFPIHVFAWLLLSELPSALQLVGGVFIVGGVTLVRIDELRRPAEVVPVGGPEAHEAQEALAQPVARG